MSKLVGFVAVLVLVLGGATAYALTQTTNVQKGNTRIIHCIGGEAVVTKTSASDAQVTCVAATTTTTTAPTTTTTTAAPTTTTTTTTLPPATTTTTTTAPPSGGPFPTASSTGVPAGTVLTSSGGITASTAGQVIDAKNINGGVRVSANNVTIQRSKITVGGGPSPVGVVIDSGITGTKIVDTEISAPGGFQGIQGSGFTAQRVNIHGFEHGIEIRGAATVLDSYIVLTDFRYPDGTTPHFDAVAGWSVNNVVVRHNTLTAPPDQTGAINFTNDFGSITNVTIDNNLLTGGGYALYLRGDSSWYSPTAGKPVTGITVTNNRFAHSQWGYASVVNAQVSYSGNVDNATGANILG